MTRLPGRMGFTPAVTGLVTVATLLAAVVGVVVGLEAGTALLLALIVSLGGLAVGVARKTDRGSITPARCPECGGLISRHAPYCKHCGTHIS
ncbi:MAG TPA: hypothetical protein VM784_15510 [Actinomycetota bacterium]|nr:hypothetical protein [Actinomycetota bacterium]